MNSEQLKERRREKRIPVSETGILIRQDDSRDLIPVRLTDISFNGVGILVNRRFTANKDFLLKYSILHREFSLPVRIAWNKDTPDGFACGCLKVPA